MNYTIRISKLVCACAFRSCQNRRVPHKTKLSWFHFMRCAHSAHPHYSRFLMLSMGSRIFPFPLRPSLPVWVVGSKWEGVPVRKHVIGFLRCWVCLRAPLPVSALEAGSDLNRVAASQSPASQWEHLSYIAQSHLYSLIPGLLGNAAVSCWIFEPNSLSVGEKIVLCVCVVVPMKEAIVPPPQRIEGLTLYIIEPLLFFL